MRKLLIIIVSTVLISQQAKAESLAECQERAGECEVILDLSARTIKQQQGVITLQAEQISDLKFNYDIVKNQLEEQRPSFFERPEFVAPAAIAACLLLKICKLNY
jgi:hypothetical protein